jgi:predicted CXXCH cytochrome family protein
VGHCFARNAQHPGLRPSLALALLLLAGLGLAFPGAALAKIASKACVNCHTMHNSQNGEPLAVDWDPATQSIEVDSGANPALIRYGGCVACHTNYTDSSTVGPNGAPIVFNVQPPEQMLAGGNFHWMAPGGSDEFQIDNNRKGHNVVSLARYADTIISPPGGLMSGQLHCAGTSGCHGNPAEADEFTAIKGSHHADDATIDGLSVATSYRFLGVSNTGTYQGVIGWEDPDWERTHSASDHNEYKGAPSATDSISALCGRCHGDLHNPTYFSADSPHFLHPTDVVIPNAGEYAGYNGGAGYNTIAPVARQDPLHVSDHGAVTLGSDCVMCLSCHRAHGTANWKLLRWDYRTTYSPPEGGCGTCHTYKN